MFRSYYEYPLETSQGDCGKLLVLSNRNIRGKICGIHFAGRNNTHYTGLAAPITEEFLLKAIALLPAEPDHSIPAQSGPLPIAFQGGEIKLNPKVSGEILPLGVLPHVHCPRKTKIMPSPLHDMFPPTCAPAQLDIVVRNGEVLDPRLLSLKKVGQPVHPVDHQIAREVSQDLIDLYESRVATTKRVFSLEEAVRGVEELDFFGPICRSTSAGYGWTHNGGKKHWLGSDEHYIIHDRVRDEVESRIRLAEQGVRKETIWMDTLKDERRPKEKVAALKTRTFAVGPLDFNLVFRMYFGAFMNHMMENRVTFESCVGTNVYSADWDRIAATLQEKGRNVIAGDFSNFDGTLNADILWCLLDIINKWYNDEHSLVRATLWCDIVHSVHICGDFLYSWTHSQPSGNPGTVIINSMYNSFVMRYTWLLLAPEQKRTMLHYNNHVSAVNYGDDNVLNISEEACEFYNQQTISTAMRTIGMEYTDEAKTGELVKYRELADVAFLKRRFRFCPQRRRWVGPLSMDTVREMTLWVKSGQDAHLNCASNVTTAAYEASFHDQPTFEEFAQTLRENTHRLKCRPMILTYEAYPRIGSTEGLYGSGIVDLMNLGMGLRPLAQTDGAAEPESE